MFEIDPLINPAKFYEIFQTYNMYIFDRFLAVTLVLLNFKFSWLRWSPSAKLSRERFIFCIIYIFKQLEE